MSASAPPVIAFASLGGTIAMTPDASGGIAPRLSADELSHVVGLNSVGTIRSTTLDSKPSASLEPDDVVAAVRWARREIDAGARGAVFAQGTDTIEETSFLADLIWDREEPLVITGAMRGASHVSADGPANIVAACRVAASPSAVGQGVVVVLDDTVHLASRVRKNHSTALSAFSSDPLGPLGVVVEGDVLIEGAPLARPEPLAEPTRSPYVPIIETYLGDHAEQLVRLDSGTLDGLVVAGFGAGHVPAALMAPIADLASRVPVVISTKAGHGYTAVRTYSFDGSEIDLQAKGAIMAGRLDPRKSRTLLWALCASGVGAAGIRARFAFHGGRSAA